MYMLKPIKSNVIVELIEKEKISTGGIVLSKTDPNEANRGLVVAIGPDVVDVKVNDEILPNWNAARKTKYEDTTYFILPEEEVVLIFED